MSRRADVIFTVTSIHSEDEFYKYKEKPVQTLFTVALLMDSHNCGP